MNKRALVVVGLLLLSGRAAADPLPAWKDFTSDEGRFTVSFPGTPTDSTMKMPTKFGNVPAHLFAVTGTASFFAVLVVDYPKESIAKYKSDQLLDSARDAALQSAKASLLKESPITANGFPGRDLTIRAPNGLVGYVRLYMVGERLFEALVSVPEASKGSPDVAKFLGSFKFSDSKAP